MQHQSTKRQIGVRGLTRRQRFDRGVQAALWSAWTLLVAATAYVSWHADMVAQRPLSRIGLVVHCSVAGVIGLVVLTLIEMRLRPWAFME